jgi:hypothetical protein
MATLSTDEREALRRLRKGDLVQEELLHELVKKKLAKASPVELTEPGRIVCELLKEIESFTRRDDSGTRSTY